MKLRGDAWLQLVFDDMNSVPVENGTEGRLSYFTDNSRPHNPGSRACGCSGTIVTLDVFKVSVMLPLLLFHPA